MEDLKSIWNKMIGSKPAEAAEKDYSKDPRYMNAQKRSITYAIRTGEEKPLKDFMEDPNLK